jgi:hypothetical protein
LKLVNGDAVWLTGSYFRKIWLTCDNMVSAHVCIAPPLLTA